MDAPLVHIFRNPILDMVYASVEAGSKRECLGDIFGRIPGGIRRDFVVDNVCNIALFKYAKGDRLEQNKLAAGRLGDLRRTLPRAFPLIGYFHSHPQRNKTLATDELPEMSDTDIANLDKFGYLGIIVAIEHSKRQFLWEARKDGSIGGTLLGKEIVFYAYRLLKEGDKKVPQMLRIVAPSALAILNASRK
jgi:proteasome lid subunit RPN8/RPN11